MKEKPDPCIDEIIYNIQSSGSYTNGGIAKVQNGLYTAYVSGPTYNYQWKTVYFYTLDNCEILKVVVK